MKLLRVKGGTKVEIKLTNEQYKALMQLVYLGNWMANAIRIDDKIKEFEEMEQYIFSFANAKEADLKKYVEYDKQLKKHFPTNFFEEEMHERYIDDYEDEFFWDELTYTLGKRDFFKKFQEEKIRNMSKEEIFIKIDEFNDKYEKEFEENGIEQLFIINK